MRRTLVICLAVAAGALSSALAAPARAGTYAWQLPTASAPGPSNPDRDTYGAAPWTYVESAGAAMPGPPPVVPPSYQPLTTYASTIDGALTGWQDPGDSGQPFVAVNRSGSPVSGAQGLEVPAGQLALQPSGDRVVAIGWTSPLSSSEQVTMSGTFVADAASSNCPGSRPTWAIEQDGSVIASQPPPSGPSSSGPEQFSATTTVAPGDTVYLVVDWFGVAAGFSQPCTTAGVTFQIKAPAAPPTVSLASPAGGETISGAQPTFSGRSTQGFGEGRTVTVRVWRGTSPAGTPAETLTADGSTGRYSVTAGPPLRNGTYTAQSEQDDLAGDAGRSDPVTFRIQNQAPSVTLSQPPAKPLLSSTPLLQGTAGTGPGDASSVSVGIWKGTAVAGAPVRALSAQVGRGGRWSLHVTPGLDDGRYTAIAVQQGGGVADGASRAATFRVKADPPALRLDQPAAGAHLKYGAVLLAGAAGTALGDVPRVAVAIYPGTRLAGRPAVSFTVPVAHGMWARRAAGLAPGLYTIVARQQDDAGHIASTAHQFRLLAPPQLISAPPVLERGGDAGIQITCTATTGSCSGTVLVVTKDAMRPRADGPSGHVRVLFGYVSSPAGHAVLVRRPVAGYVAAALRRAAPVKVEVTVALSDSAGRPIRASETMELRVRR